MIEALGQHFDINEQYELDKVQIVLRFYESMTNKRFRKGKNTPLFLVNKICIFRFIN